MANYLSNYNFQYTQYHISIRKSQGAAHTQRIIERRVGGGVRLYVEEGNTIKVAAKEKF